MSFLRKVGAWLDDRLGISDTLMPLARHLVPPGAKWSYVFGSATLFCLVLQVVTGVALTLLYQPTSSEAYKSLEFITHQAVLGARYGPFTTSGRRAWCYWWACT